MGPVRPRSFLSLALALAGALALVFYQRSSGSNRQGASGPASAERQAGGDGNPATSSASLAANPGEPVAEPTPGAGNPAREQARATLMAALTKARKLRETGAPKRNEAKIAEMPAPLAIANKTGETSEWQERQLATLNELLGECHTLASEEAGELTGTIGIRFTLAAEPELGGLVDALEFMEDYSTIDNANMRECMRESMYALELDPPPEGMQVGREITLRFEKDE
jgi:hypothetical protein